jgi:hypothetical protein
MSARNFTQKRVLLLGLVLFLATAGSEAQRSWGRPYRHHGYGWYHSPRIYSFPRPFVSVGFAGIHYRYYGGYFYRPFPGYYRAVAPPMGIRITVLPPGCRRIYVGSYPYYYDNGTFYSPSEGRNEYTVVTPPYGAKVPVLPTDAQAVVIDGQKYYVSDGTYYIEEIGADNKLWYTVVGVNGELRPENERDENTILSDRVGDRVEKLPSGCRTIVISGKKYFEAPSGLYYEEIISPNKVYYEVVGKPDE